MKTKNTKKTNKPKYTRAALIKRLGQLPTPIITFRKVDGSKRVMNCTLWQDMIPKDLLPTGKKASKPSTTSIAAFDIANRGWRAFRIASVISVK